MSLKLSDKGGGWGLNTEIEQVMQHLETIQNTRPPARGRDRSVGRGNSSSSRVPINWNNFKPGTIVFPWYKRPKPVRNSLEETQ
jgi:hypothetical protein